LFAARVPYSEVQRCRSTSEGSLLIIVVVTMDFMAQVQNYLMSQQYESLLKKARL